MFIFFTISCGKYLLIPPKIIKRKVEFSRKLFARRFCMRKVPFPDSQILTILKQADSGVPVVELCSEHDIGNLTF